MHSIRPYEYIPYCPDFIRKVFVLWFNVPVNNYGQVENAS